jgi:hypothetical protein
MTKLAHGKNKTHQKTNRKKTDLASWVSVGLFPSYFQNLFHLLHLLLVKPLVFEQNSSNSN